MVAGIRVEGAEGYAELSRALRSMSPKARTMMRREVNAAAKPLVPALRSAVMALDSKAQGSQNVGRAAARVTGQATEAKAARALRGSGLRQSVARSIRVVQKDNGYADQVGVFVKSEPSRTLPRDQRSLPRRMDKGTVRHPVFGNREAWVSQSFTPAGWFTRTAQTHAPLVRARLARILETYRRDLAAALRRAA